MPDLILQFSDVEIGDMHNSTSQIATDQPGAAGRILFRWGTLSLEVRTNPQILNWDCRCLYLDQNISKSLRLVKKTHYLLVLRWEIQMLRRPLIYPLKTSIAWLVQLLVWHSETTGQLDGRCASFHFIAILTSCLETTPGMGWKGSRPAISRCSQGVQMVVTARLTIDWC